MDKLGHDLEREARELNKIEVDVAKGVQDTKNNNIWQRLDAVEDHLDTISMRTYYLSFITTVSFLIIIALLSIVLFGGS